MNTNYMIEAKYDFLTGMYLIAKIEDSELDENALYTIQDDCPDFILPFNHIKENGKSVFTYKVGDLCKLRYFYGEVSVDEYVSLWRGILSPLLECKDWFMNPCGFFLDADYLYFDKNKNTIVYVYIPCLRGCSGNDAFAGMATQIVSNIKVFDPVLENKVLRSILGSFDPNDFLNMLQEHIDRPATPLCMLPAPEAVSEECPEKLQEEITEKKENVNGGFKLFSGRSKKKSEPRRNGFKNALPAAPVMAAPANRCDIIDATEETKIILEGKGLRCVGRASLPQVIAVDIADGGIFTIGRYDVNVGKKRSCFEFGAKTKAVSRRHAAIERHGDAYQIVDLSSSAGTYVNDKKLPPNTPVSLSRGVRVSFGNLGADYVWESN